MDGERGPPEMRTSAGSPAPERVPRTGPPWPGARSPPACPRVLRLQARGGGELGREGPARDSRSREREDPAPDSPPSEMARPAKQRPEKKPRRGARAARWGCRGWAARLQPRRAPPPLAAWIPAAGVGKDGRGRAG
jgi:hypothetical protein